MEQPKLKTNRCVLIAPIKEDASWLYELFNDPDVIKHIDGFRLFNNDVKTVEKFIEKMRINASKGLGMMWCVKHNKENIGVILAYDLMDSPFLSFAISNVHRRKGYGKEIVFAIYTYIRNQFGTPTIETSNFIVKENILPGIASLNDIV